MTDVQTTNDTAEASGGGMTITVRPEQAVTSQKPREIIAVNSEIPILDTGYFAQMQRVATVMAECSLVPEALLGEGSGKDWKPFPMPMRIANCFRIVNQAVRWNADPFSVADCCSIINGRLMYEGKLVAAILAARFGLRFSYKFDGTGEAMSVVVAAFDEEGLPITDPITGEIQTVKGTVSQWKTSRANSPWSSPANYERQMRYRGGREWTRAYRSEAILGIITDDDNEILIENRQAIAATKPTLTAGFGDNAPLRSAAIEQVRAEANASSPQDKPEGPSGAVIDAEVTEPMPAPPAEPKKRGRPKKVQPTALKAIAEAEPELVQQVIDDHGSEAERPTETASAQSAEQEPDTSASATDASGAFQEADIDGDEDFPGDREPWSEEEEDEEAGTKSETSKPVVTNEAVKEPDPGKSIIFDGPAFRVYEGKLAEAKNMPEISTALKMLVQSDDWSGADAEGQRMARLDAWTRIEELVDGGEMASFDFRTNPQAVRLWLETEPKSAEIREVYGILRESETFKAMSADNQGSFAKIIAESMQAAQKREQTK